MNSTQASQIRLIARRAHRVLASTVYNQPAEAWEKAIREFHGDAGRLRLVEVGMQSDGDFAHTMVFIWMHSGHAVS